MDLPKDVLGPKVPPRIKRIGRSDSRASIAAIGDTARAPEGPSCQRRSVTEALGVGLEEIKLVCRVFVDGTAEKGEEDEESCSCDED